MVKETPLPTPLALTPCLPTELLTFVLRQTYPATIIICSTRKAFLSTLFRDTSLPVPEAVPEVEKGQSPAEQGDLPAAPSSDPATGEEDATEDPPLPPKHPLLVPSLRQISRSRYTHTAFVPTVSHLRAYLSVLSTDAALQTATQERPSQPDEAVGQSPLLLVYGLIELHRETSEWSTQGLGNTLAGLVEAGVGTRRRVVIVEGREDAEEEEEEGGNIVVDDDDGAEIDGEEEERAAKAERVRQRRHEGVWHERLPILSGNVRRLGADAEYVGRTVEVGVVLRRWFKFGRGDWEDGSYA